MNLLYLGLLLFSLSGLAALDFKHKLVFAKNPKAALVAMVPAYLLFVAWDIAGISNGIFFKGESPFLSGVMVGPEFPLEELFFLALLCYCTLIIANWFERDKK